MNINGLRIQLFALFDRMAGLAFLHGSHTPRCSAVVDKQFEGYYTLQFMTCGGLDLRYDNSRYRLEGQWLWPAYPGPHIYFAAAQGFDWWEHRYIAFQGPLVAQWYAQGLMPSGPQPAPQGAEFCKGFDTMVAWSHSVSPWRQRRAVNALESILIELAEARHEPMGQEPWLETALTHLKNNCQSAVSTEYLAQSLHMAESTLRRKFRQATGMAINAYVIQLRVGNAKARLVDTHDSIDMIASDLGYCDVYFFSRQFKQVVGLTPSQYRKSRLA